MIDLIIAVFVLLGAAFAFIGSIALARFPDVYTRLHGPTKATTLGVGAVLLGAIVSLTVENGTPALREILILVFFFLTAPVSAHLLSKAALHRHCDSLCEPPENDVEEPRS